MRFTQQQCLDSLKCTEEYLNRATAPLDESDASFIPAEGMISAAAQLAHIALTVDWFLDAAFRKREWDFNFEQHMTDACGYKTLKDARARVTKAFSDARKTVEGLSEEQLNELFPADDFAFANTPRACIFPAIMEHTAHHRGALSVYMRLRGKVPKLPYMDE